MPTLPDFEFQKEGRRITFDEYMLLADSKIELINGQLFGSKRDQLTMLGLLINNLGTDEVLNFIEKYSKD